MKQGIINFFHPKIPKIRPKKQKHNNLKTQIDQPWLHDGIFASFELSIFMIKSHK
jgi:hypothetical protein